MKQFTYKKSIDTKVIKAASQILNVKVISSKKINQGIVNHVYKVVTDDGIYIVKVFRNQHWPEDGKLEWVEKQLQKHKIPHAKMVYYSREAKYFPYGLMITEFIEGLNGWDAIKKGRHNIFDSWKESGKILRKIHSIKGQKFGHVKNGKGEEKSFLKYELMKAKEKLSELIKLKKISADTAQILLSKIDQTLKPFDKRFRPVLIHGDASRDNSILTSSGKFILIDWDNAKFSDHLVEYTRFTSWMTVMPKWKNLQTRVKAKKSFFQGYGNIGFTQSEIKIIEPAMHMIFFISLLKLYVERKENYYVNKILRMLNRLIK